jgi:phage terminase large subunit-like protein
MSNPRQYAADVLAGKILVCEHVRNAVLRNERDLATGHERGLSFDHEAGMRPLQFFSFLNHYKGEWAGKPFELSPWQAWITYTIFGWKNKKGLRRFNYAYIEVAKKNGKTPWMAGMALYMLLADGEAGAECYTAARTRDQAGISFSDAKTMAKQSRHLAGYLTIEEHRLFVEKTVSILKPLASDKDSMEGKNVHFGLIDEYHVHKDDGVVQSLKSATVNRTQPLIAIITTAGTNPNGPCYNYRKTVINVLRGSLEDDTLFGIVYTLDEGDDHENPELWIKSNPNLDVSVRLDALQREFTQARNRPSELNNFLTKNLNKWTRGKITWIKDELVAANQRPLDLEALRGKICFGGLDLASTSDITSLSLMFPFRDQNDVVRFEWLNYSWVPEEMIAEKMLHAGIDYGAFIRDGHLETTPGNTTDYRYIRQRLNELSEMFDIQSVAYDRYNSSQLVIELMEDGFEMVKYSMSMVDINPPTKEFERLFSNGLINHGSNTLLRWMMGNVHIITNSNGDIRPDKKSSSEKIDGVVSGIIAVGQYLTDRRENVNKRSVYEDRDILTL